VVSVTDVIDMRISEMKPAPGGSNSTGLVLSIVVLVVAWVAIIWVTRRVKRDMSGDD
jgi:hypothetical protein